MPATLENSAVAIGLEKVSFFIPIPKKSNAKECSNYRTIALISHASMEKEMATPILLPGKSHGWKSLVCYSPWGCKESDTTERLHHTLVK